MKLAAILAATALVVSACGGDGPARSSSGEVMYDEGVEGMEPFPAEPEGEGAPLQTLVLDVGGRTKISDFDVLADVQLLDIQYRDTLTKTVGWRERGRREVPAKNGVYALLEFRIENWSGTDTFTDMSPGDYWRSASGERLSADEYPVELPENIPGDGVGMVDELGPGEHATGWVVWDVPDEAGELVVEPDEPGGLTTTIPLDPST